MSGYHVDESDIAQAAVDYALSQMDTIRVGVVVRYDAQTRRAAILPSTGFSVTDPVTREVTWVDAAEVQDVPVVMPGTDRNPTHLELRSGDLVLLLTCSHAIDEVLGGGKSGIRPQSTRQHKLRDSLAIPFTLSQASTSERLAEIAVTGADVRIGDASLAGPLVTTASLDATWAALSAAMAAAALAAVDPGATESLGTLAGIFGSLPSQPGTLHLKGS